MNYRPCDIDAATTPGDPHPADDGDRHVAHIAVADPDHGPDSEHLDIDIYESLTEPGVIVVDVDGDLGGRTIRTLRLVVGDQTIATVGADPHGPTTTTPGPGWIAVVAGNPVDGFSYHGPYQPNTPELERLVEDELAGQDYWYAPLTPPAHTDHDDEPLYTFWCETGCGARVVTSGPDAADAEARPCPATTSGRHAWSDDPEPEPDPEPTTP